MGDKGVHDCGGTYGVRCGRQQFFPAVRGIAGFFGKLSLRTHERMFGGFDRSGRKLERHPVDAVAILVDDHHPVVVRHCEDDDETVGLPHVEIRNAFIRNLDLVFAQPQVFGVDDERPRSQGPMWLFHLGFYRMKRFRPSFAKEPDVQEVLVIGGGTMGAGIAFVAAKAGYRVAIVDPDPAARERALARIRGRAERAGNVPMLDRISFLNAIPAASSASIAIEAAPERFDLKRDIFLALEAALSPDAIVATNTSSLSVEELADLLRHDERVLGIHFFNPPAAMKLVEIVALERTSSDALERARAFVEGLGKTAVYAADTPGFIVNRVARPFYLQSMRALDLDVATVPELDALARAAGFPMGPFELMDVIGLDVNYATSLSVYERLQAERLKPNQMQRRMVEEGCLGRKSGRGFYDYRDGDPERMEFQPETTPEDRVNVEEVIVVLGFGGVADELCERLQPHFANVVQVTSDELLDQMPSDATVVFDVGDGTSDRRSILANIDARLGAEAMLFVDAYATDVTQALTELRHPERLIGYGILSSLDRQRAVEIADHEYLSEDALALAQEIFEALDKAICIVADEPGLYLGRTIGAIVNEAVIAVQEGVASAEDVDTAMRLGVNYPRGPIAWGREIGGRRLTRILQRVADSEGEAFAPHRSLWLLDVEESEEEEALDVRT